MKNIHTKIFLFLLIVPIFSLGLYEYTLIDSETFQSYTVYTPTTPNATLAIESSNKWNCTDGTKYPNCVTSSGVTTQQAKFLIDQEGSNKYLVLYTNGYDAAQYRSVDLRWNHTNLSARTGSVDQYYTIQYKLRIESYGYDQTWGTGLGKVFTSVRDSNQWYDSPTHLGYTQFGGSYSYNTLTNYTKLKYGASPVGFGVFDWKLDRFNGVESPQACYIRDFVWHELTKIYHFNASNYADISVYVDGNLCYQEKIDDQVVSGTPFYILYFSSSGDVIADYDDIKIYDGKYVPQPYFGAYYFNCPSAGCLYYDDFQYTFYDYLGKYAYESVSSSSLYQPYTRESKLYLNETFLQHDFIPNTATAISGTVKFIINDSSPNPIDFDKPIYYYFGISCNKSSELGVYENPFFFNVYFMRDDNYTLSENKSVMIVYSNNKVLGSYINNGGDIIVIDFDYDRTVNTAYFKISQKFTDNFKFTLADSDDFIVKTDSCNGFTGIEMGMIENDYSKAQSEYIGIDLVYVYDDSVSSQNPIFSNITVNDSIIKGNVDDKIKDMAYTLGFRTKSGKLFFWLIIMFVFMAFLFNSNAPSSAKIIGAPIVGIGFLVLGFYLGFIDTIVFAFIILVIAILGALVVQRIFTGSGSQGA